MCLCCSAEAVDVAEVVKDFFLVRAAVDVDGWKSGQYALVVCNDPSYIFKTPPRLQPVWNDADDDKSLDAEDAWLAEATAFISDLKQALSLNECHNLVGACVVAGYDRAEDGDVAFWLYDRIAKLIQDDKANI